MDEPIDIDSLLSRTEAFIATTHAVRDSFELLPDKQHIATCINYADLQEMRETFTEELVSTVTTYVYSPGRQREICDRLKEGGRDEAGAWRALYRRAQSKFRPSSLQGQFSELLLCNLLQHYYKAAPLLRKMPLTTNPQLERNGADALHLGVLDGRYVLYIGEAKTYNRAKGGLREALRDSIADIIDEHYAKHRSEINLYTYEDFIPEELERIAVDYIEGRQPDLEVHLVCIVTYDDKSPRTGKSRAQLLESTISSLREEAALAKKSPMFRKIPPELMPRMNYILFPVREMNQLIADFGKELGR